MINYACTSTKEDCTKKIVSEFCDDNNIDSKPYIYFNYDANDNETARALVWIDDEPKSHVLIIKDDETKIKQKNSIFMTP